MHVRQLVKQLPGIDAFSLKRIESLKKKMCKSTGTPTKPFTIIVEGNIGSGKTTFLNYFKNYKNILILSEPVEAWKDVAGHDMLQLLYSDIKTWAFTFQTYVQLTMMKLHDQKTDAPVKMMERSIYSARNVFVENLYQLNILTGPEVAVLDEWYKWMLKKREFSVDLIVYLKIDPEIAFQRIQERCRAGEQTITLDYIKNLHDCHENWLSKKAKFCPAPVLVLDANKNLNDIKEEYNFFLSQVKLFSSKDFL